jgi:hypothetical protein
MATQGCLGQDKVVCGKTRLLSGGARLFATEQGYPRQDNLVCGDATLSTTEQGYPGQNKIAGRKLTLRRDGQAFRGLDRRFGRLADGRSLR